MYCVPCPWCTSQSTIKILNHEKKEECPEAEYISFIKIISVCEMAFKPMTSVHIWHNQRQQFMELFNRCDALSTRSNS